jgi:hypothetical protein
MLQVLKPPASPRLRFLPWLSCTLTMQECVHPSEALKKMLAEILEIARGSD